MSIKLNYFIFSLIIAKNNTIKMSSVNNSNANKNLSKLSMDHQVSEIKVVNSLFINFHSFPRNTKKNTIL